METKKVIFFYMNRCNRCERQKLAIEDFLKMADGLGYSVEEVNAAENIDLADKYNLDDMPAIIIINGDSVHNNCSVVKFDGDIDFNLAVKEINGSF